MAVDLWLRPAIVHIGDLITYRLGTNLINGEWTDFRMSPHTSRMPPYFQDEPPYFRE